MWSPSRVLYAQCHVALAGSYPIKSFSRVHTVAGDSHPYRPLQQRSVTVLGAGVAAQLPARVAT